MVCIDIAYYTIIIISIIIISIIIINKSIMLSYSCIMHTSTSALCCVADAWCRWRMRLDDVNTWSDRLSSVKSTNHALNWRNSGTSATSRLNSVLHSHHSTVVICTDIYF